MESGLEVELVPFPVLVSSPKPILRRFGRGDMEEPEPLIGVPLLTEVGPLLSSALWIKWHLGP